MEANERNFGQGQMVQRQMAKPQNSKQQHQRARPRHEKIEEFYCSQCAKQCRRCGAHGHFSLKRSTESRQPRVNTVDDDEKDEEEYLLNCLKFANDEDGWFEEVTIAGQAVVFKLDTDAQCNVLTKQVVDVLSGTISKTATKRLVPYNGRKIYVVGDQIEVCSEE
jgi:hypothetical protein